MTTLFSVLRKTYLALGQMEVTTATGGSTTTAIDTKLGDTYGDEDLNGSSLFVIRDAAGAGAAPEGEAQLITGYAVSTNTITVGTAFSVAIAAGDTLGIAKNVWPLLTVIELANDALQSLGTIQLCDTSLTTISGQSEYALPVALKYKVQQVQLQMDAETNANEWMNLHNWTVSPSAAGSTGLLIFNEELPAGYVLKLWYEAEHPRVSAMSDKISETIHSEYATRLVVDKALEYQTRRTNGTDPFMLQTSNKAMNDVQEAKLKFTMPKVKKAKILTPLETKRFLTDEG